MTNQEFKNLSKGDAVETPILTGTVFSKDEESGIISITVQTPLRRKGQRSRIIFNNVRLQASAPAPDLLNDLLQGEIAKTGEIIDEAKGFLLRDQVKEELRRNLSSCGYELDNEIVPNADPEASQDGYAEAVADHIIETYLPDDSSRGNMAIMGAIGKYITDSLKKNPFFFRKIEAPIMEPEAVEEVKLEAPISQTFPLLAIHHQRFITARCGAYVTSDGIQCPHCGAEEAYKDARDPKNIDKWIFMIRAFRVDNASECRNCDQWFVC